ncbi:Heme-degrading monooxygenase HmoA [Streptoalloteichus tenebrarius]|uniref:Heme-degrading monooxygenase HmoA n=1 Tax=Streptoalloteichus tenebrarius (strain ATCC 17920 / DSM 40477 / JCM 4838 / CBS 697.72 / NBRC 16177 / NCIMB 11028 / NRRL B-12390 / A12253. 1 / ISP 5477) TaxID=1933 RepID=A0ABT1HX16_STRSD|nr:antibiotic biosynthesis monooxygenase [Streptoalloteichus tenebrarius]MCP2260067.1 Heme-degrading monooxygenase HmoA [Streptoalloteichus tenebrarius]BFF00614.1 antibiotic biosynthesis monooxygenase [Streptoalloteichus tenebrarius]
METSGLARLPRPPYYAVIFSSRRTDVDEGYQETARRMLELAAGRPGFLGVEHARDDGLGITVSYWRDEDAIRAWRRDLEHVEAQDQGRTRWYEAYEVRVARVERSYGFER